MDVSLTTNDFEEAVDICKNAAVLDEKTVQNEPKDEKLFPEKNRVSSFYFLMIFLSPNHLLLL